MSSKQDRQGVRKASDIEQKYGLGQFMYDQNKKNQDLSKGISNLGDSFSNYKTENEERLSDMSDSFNKTINGVEEGLLKEIEALAKGMFNMIYPVGHIYLSISATNPSTLFGGTWERIEDTFLLAAGSSYAAGTTGGEAAHTLTINEMPSHTHNKSNGDASALNGVSGQVARSRVSSGSSTYAFTSTEQAGLTYGGNVTNTGGGAAHNNMPPYLAVYVWKRTA